MLTPLETLAIMCILIAGFSALFIVLMWAAYWLEKIWPMEDWE